MDIVHIIFTSIGSIIVIFFLTKIIGNKQVSQLNMFDYINGITIGSIAAEMATSTAGEFLKPLIAMVLYALAAVILALISTKSLKARRFFNGRTLMLLDGGNLYRQNFKKAKIDLNEFLTECRDKGYFDISEIQSAFIEPNGKISVMPKAAFRPANPNDLKIVPTPEKPVISLIEDGCVLSGNLSFSGNDETWLNEQLKLQGINSEKDVFFATVDCDGNFRAYPKLSEKPVGDMFE